MSFDKRLDYDILTVQIIFFSNMEKIKFTPFNADT